jgi:hypothetical protein
VAGHRLGPGLDHPLEGFALVGGVALDRFDEVGDQVVAASQLGVDVGLSKREVRERLRAWRNDRRDEVLNQSLP